MKVESLRSALENEFGMDAEDADEIAEVVMDAFAGAREVHDDLLDPDLRAIFYTLEAKRLVSFRREEYTGERGERRRAFFWRLREKALREASAPQAASVEHDPYAALPAAAWARRAA